MHFRILGSGAGGGLPQWNCHCTNCALARQNSPLVQPRTQCCAAISADKRHWFLLNASPDIRTQVLALAQSNSSSVRRNPFEAILLNDADLDHVLGLFVLREGGRLNVHCSSAVREQLTLGIGIESTLSHYCGLVWREVSQTAHELLCADGNSSGLLVRALPLPGTGPRYARALSGDVTSHIAWEFTDAETGRRLIHAPCVAHLSAEFFQLLNQADVVVFDGTFYHDDELARAHAGAVTAQRMGHVPVEQSAPALAELRAQVIYTHINNTNPIARQDSAERAAVERLRIQVAYDGFELTL